MVFTIFLFIFSFFVTFELTETLLELHPSVDNDILSTELKIRNATQNIFSSLWIPSNVDKNTEKLKDLSLVHNYLTSFTLKDYNKLREITKFTKTHKSDNNTLLDIINDVLDEDENLFGNKQTEVISDNVIKHADEFVKNLETYKKMMKINETKPKLKEEIFKFVQFRNKGRVNTTLFNTSLFVDSDTEGNESGDNEASNSSMWEPSGRRIFQGKRTKIKHFPFVASIHEFEMFMCAGSIISHDLVITAASCLQLAWNNRFFRENPRYLSVRIGSTFYKGGGEVISALEVYFYPSYDPKTLKNNLAIIRLHRRIHFKRKRTYVKKIDFDRYQHTLPETTPGITIVGWGAKTASNVVKEPWVNRISFATLDVYGLADCQEVYSKKYVTKLNFCAGFFSHGVGACNKDVGDPGIANGILMGVTSFGAPNCGTPDTPTVFTKLGYYSNWIEEIMEDVPPHGRKLTSTTKEPVFRLPEAPTPTTRRPKVPPLRTKEEELFKKFIEALFDANKDHSIIESLRTPEDNKDTTSSKPHVIESVDKVPSYMPPEEDLMSIPEDLFDYDSQYVTKPMIEDDPNIDPDQKYDKIMKDINENIVQKQQDTQESVEEIVHKKHKKKDKIKNAAETQIVDYGKDSRNNPDDKKSKNKNNLDKSEMDESSEKMLEEILMKKMKPGLSEEYNSFPFDQDPEEFVKELNLNLEHKPHDVPYEFLQNKKSLDKINENYPVEIRDMRQVTQILDHGSVEVTETTTRFSKNVEKEHTGHWDTIESSSIESIFTSDTNNNFAISHAHHNKLIEETINNDLGLFGNDNEQITENPTETETTIEPHRIRKSEESPSTDKSEKKQISNESEDAAPSLQIDTESSESRKLRDLDEAILTLLYLSDLEHEGDKADKANHEHSVEDTKALSSHEGLSIESFVDLTHRANVTSSSKETSSKSLYRLESDEKL